MKATKEVVYFITELDKNKNEEILDNDGNTIFHKISHYSYEALVMILTHLKNKLGKEKFIQLLNTANNYGLSPLHYKAMFDFNEEILALLITEGAVAETYDNEGLTPLHSMASVGNIRATKFFLKYLEVNVKSKDQEQTPLHLATAANRAEIIQILLESGAQINPQNKFGNTPLHLAIIENSGVAMEILLNKGASLDIINKDGISPLDMCQEDFNNPKCKISSNVRMNMREILERHLKTKKIFATFEAYVKSKQEIVDSVAQKVGKNFTDLSSKINLRTSENLPLEKPVSKKRSISVIDSSNTEESENKKQEEGFAM